MSSKHAIKYLFTILSLFALASCEVGRSSSDNLREDMAQLDKDRAQLVKDRIQREHELEVACISAGRRWYGNFCGGLISPPITMPAQVPVSISDEFHKKYWDEINKSTEALFEAQKKICLNPDPTLVAAGLAAPGKWDDALDVCDFSMGYPE